MNIRKKNKRKLGLIILIVLLILIAISIIIYLNITKTNTKEIEEVKEIDKSIIISDILNKIEDNYIDETFLMWIDNNYENSLETLKELLDQEEYTKDIWHKVTNNTLTVLKDLYQDKYTEESITRTNEEITLSFIGDVSLAEDWYIMDSYDKNNQDLNKILDEEVVKILKESDFTIANNEFTITTKEEKINKLYNFKSNPERLKIYQEIGVDLVTLANNHVYDYGLEGLYDTLDYLKEYNIPYIGAGRNLEEAKTPYYYVINGYKIAFVNATRAEKNIVTKEATSTDGGVLRCYDTQIFESVIEEAKQNSDYLVALVHWGKEDSTELEEVQIETSRTYLDKGADIIVGTHAHVLQGIEYYEDKLIMYNLGDFIFNNETKDTGIFQIKIDLNGNLEYYFIPCLEQEEYTYILYDQARLDLIDRMNNISINAKIDNDGKIIKVN